MPHITCHMPYAISYISYMPQARLRPEMRTAWLTFARLEAKSQMHYATDSSETNDINWVSAERLKWLPSRAGLLKSHLERATARCRPGPGRHLWLTSSAFKAPHWASCLGVPLSDGCCWLCNKRNQFWLGIQINQHLGSEFNYKRAQRQQQ